MLTAKGLRCELLDGRCGKLAVTTVAGVKACRRHARALREITGTGKQPDDGLCRECHWNLSGPRGGLCHTCVDRHKNERRRERRQAA